MVAFLWQPLSLLQTKGTERRPSYLRGFLTNTHSFAGFWCLAQRRNGARPGRKAAVSCKWVCRNRSCASAHLSQIFTAPSTWPLEVLPPMSLRVLCPYIPSLYLSKAWGPIVLRRWVIALTQTRFSVLSLFTILRMGQFSYDGAALLAYL